MTQSLRERALDDTALGWVQRGVWIVCVGVYLTVFVSGVTAGGDEVPVVARATGLTLIAALLGRVVLRLAANAEVSVRQVPTAMQDGPVGSLVDLMASTNVAQHTSEADAA